MLKELKSRVAAAIALTTAGALALSGCSAPAETPAETSADTTASESKELVEVSVQLDWTPNTNHLGLYVGQHEGYFAENGIKLNILPYASASPAELVSEGVAQFGIGTQAGDQASHAAGRNVQSVYAITQSDTGRLVTMASNEELQRPRDFDGKVFAGFGVPLWTQIAAATIKGDGGKGEFEEVALDTAAYDALSSGRVDFTLSIVTWEDIQMEIEGHPYRAFKYQDYGVPPQHGMTLVGNVDFIKENPEVAKKFIDAVKKGFQFSVDNPDKAADILIEMAPELANQSELVHNSAELMATDGFFVSKDRGIGELSPEFYSEFGAFMVENGLLMDSDGKAITEAPDWSEYFTNDLVK